MSEIERIGRAATPRERGLQLVVENPDVLDHVACNLMSDRLEIPGLAAQERWVSMSENAREQWRESALQAIRDFTAADPGPPPDDDDPDPGASRPTMAAAS